MTAEKLDEQIASGAPVNEDGTISSSFAKFLTEEQIAAIHERANAKTGDLLLFIADAKNEVLRAQFNK